MAANSAPTTLLLLRILSVPNLADEIADYVIMRSQQMPVELGNPAELNTFFGCTNALIPFGLQRIGFQRRWMVTSFMDRMTNVPGVPDTSFVFWPHMRNLELVHEVDITPPAPMTVAQHAAADYGLAQNAIRNVRTRFTGLRSHLLHVFEFDQNNLDLQFNARPQERVLMHNRLAIWVGLARLRNDQNVPFEIRVCFADSVNPYPNNPSTDYDGRGQTDVQVANNMLHHFGEVFRIR